MLRFGLPPLFGADTLASLTHQLRTRWSAQANQEIDVVVARDHQALYDAALSGAVDALHAPALLSARLMHDGVPTHRMFVRGGEAHVRAAILVRNDDDDALAVVQGMPTQRRLRVAVVDRWSVVGGCLPLLHLAALGLEVEVHALGSHQATLQALCAGQADVAAVPATTTQDRELDQALHKLWPAAIGKVREAATTQQGPADGVAMRANHALWCQLVDGLKDDEPGRTLLSEVFGADDVQPADLAHHGEVRDWLHKAAADGWMSG
jgi:ABC-type phosphate/phosphonate transport system substrate-binding protein